MKKTAQQGFTLIELLVVVTIIGILAGIVVASINVPEYLNQTKDARRISDLLSVQTAISSAIADNEIALINTIGCTTCDSISGSIAINGTGWAKFDDIKGNGLSGYIHYLPKDPRNEGDYKFMYFSDGLNFELNTKLESEKYAENMLDDGGNDPSMYERGFDLTLN